jgi:hypothetical protein
MKGLVFNIFVVFPLVVQAVPGKDVYPNSGPTDARVDENTDITPATAPAQEQEADEKNERPIKKDDDFVKGPYDKDGFYRYVPEVRE